MSLLSLLTRKKQEKTRSRPDLHRLAQVREGTHIDMLEYDLFLFRRSTDCSDWETMVKEWLDKGASLDLYFHTIHPKSEEVIRELQELYKRLGLYNISITSEGLESLGTLKDFKTFHFTVIHNPDQIWIEGHHRINKNLMYDCTYARRTSPDIPFDKNFSRLNEIIRTLRTYSQKL